MPDWISVNSLSKIQGITPRAIRKAINNNRYVARTVPAKRGVKYEIYVPSLDKEVQNLIDFEKSKNEIEKADCRQRVAGLRVASRNSFIADKQANREPSLRKNSKIPTHAKQIALARFDLVNLWIDYKNHNKEDKTKAGKDFLNAYNDGNLYRNGIRC